MDKEPQKKLTKEEIKRQLAEAEARSDARREENERVRKEMEEAMVALRELRGEEGSEETTGGKKKWWKFGSRKGRESTESEIESEEEIAREVENMPEGERWKLGNFLRTLGFNVEKKKNEFFTTTFDNLASSEKIKETAVGKFCEKMKDSFIRDAKAAKQKIEDAKSGEDRRSLTNVGLLTGNIFKYGRIISDFTTHSVASPLRYVMMVGAIGARTADAAKEARLSNEEVIEKTRITDTDKAYDEAWEIYQNAIKVGEGKVASAEELKKAYLSSLPRDLADRMEREPGVATSIIQRIIKSDLKGVVYELERKIIKIRENEKLKPEERERKIEMLLRKEERNLLDYDRILTQYGTVDELAMTARYAKAAGNALVWGATLETIAISAQHLWDNLAQTLSHTTTEAQVIETQGHPMASDSSQVEKPPIQQATIMPDTTYADVAPTPDSTAMPHDTLSNAHADTLGHTPEAPAQVEGTPSEPTPPQVSVEHMEVNPDAVIHKGEGIEHALRRQITHNYELAQKLGYKGPNDPDKLYEFSCRKAHELAIENGYIGKMVNGQLEQVHVMEADKVAYQIADAGNGHAQIIEVDTKSGNVFEKAGHEFEKGSTEAYEKVVVQKPGEICGPDGKPIPRAPEAVPAPEHIEPTPKTIDIKTPAASAETAPEPTPIPKEEIIPKGPTNEEKIAQVKRNIDDILVKHRPESPAGEVNQPTGPYNYVGDQRVGVYDQYAYHRPAGYNQGYNNRAPIHDQFVHPRDYAGGNRVGHDETVINDAFKEPRGERPAMGNREFDNSKGVKDIFKDQKLGGENRGYDNSVTPGDPWAMQKIEDLNLPTQLQDNIFNLRPNELAEISRVHNTIIPRIAPDTLTRSGGNIDNWWSQMKNLSAREILAKPSANQGHLADYLKRLTRVTGLQPAGGGLFNFQEEQSVDNFIYHAMQKAAEMGRLSELR